MANARLKQARRRASTRPPPAAQPTDVSLSQTPPPVSASPAVSDAQNEPENEREALQVALLARKSRLEAQIQTLTLGKTLVKGTDPPSMSEERVHRDFLLQEMEWMAADFAQERKWRARNAKTLSQALVSHLDRQEARLARQEKGAELARRRAAARVGRDVKKFWSKIDKIIAFKVKLQADELRQRHMQKHLTQLVTQTEKYATALAASFQEAEGEKEILEEIKEDEDGDFEMIEEEDDETTIAQEEEEDGPVSKRQAAAEVAELQEENELSIEELKARYYRVGEEVDGDFVLTREEEDDETTIEEQERQEGELSPSKKEEELRLLQEEGELSIEELRAQYTAQSEESDEAEDDTMEINSVQSEEREEAESQCSDMTLTESVPVKRSGYKRPYLLTSRLDLREYQEAGVNWLISMCERRINGILADEMGLGKTIQTISMLAHLACAQGLWGPHLIVVPTSCLVNWEMEFKRWCPAFKVLTYFGSAKRRKELRQGWSKQNAFQVCITSYQLVVQDAHCFKRKKWYYLILDEAHNIKNWKSLRWQTLLTFSSQRRLLLTGTPLQNNLLELWALMHFLMPHVFASRKEFSYWFQNPLALMVENGSDPTQGDNGVEGGKDLVTQLHGIIRPFVLRRLKKDVAKQLPGKFEHVISCQLSKRQRFLYEDFISRSTTRRAMFGRSKGNFMSMMNVLMQLRKVCNHPDLFEPRPISSPLDMPSINVPVPSRCGFLVDEMVNERPRVALWTGFNLPGLELQGSEKSTSKRRRDLFFYDVSVPLPSDTIAAVPTAYEGKKDLVRRIKILAAKRREYWQQKRESVLKLQQITMRLYLDEPVFGNGLLQACTMPIFISPAMEVHKHRSRPFLDAREPTEALQMMVRDPEERLTSLQAVVNKSVCYVPKARASPARVLYGGGGFVYDDKFVLSRKAQFETLAADCLQPVAQRMLAPYYNTFKRTQLFFPDKALVQFDCGKLQQLAVLLRTLKRGGHRCLIFTQMSSMLNILEVFLNLHGHTYFRLDGATKVDKRQMLMERFNRDEKIFCFILSTRSGGLGINLTGADAVIFYDSDWNPAMDAQAQDRAHRIGQTRDVHIYRLVSEHTVEENILRKAQQKRHLDFLVMSEGQFTTDFFSKASLRELMLGSTEEEIEHVESESEEEDTDEDSNEVSLDTVENAMAQLEDEDDVVAMKGARAEYLQEQNEFEEDAGGARAQSGDVSRPSTPSSASERGEDENLDDTAEVERGKREVLTPTGSEHESMDEDAVKLTGKRQRIGSKDEKNLKRRKISDQNSKNGDKIREKARDAAEEQKLQAWKASVSSLQGFEDSLNPVDRYALHFREDVDPLYAYTPAQQAEALAGIDSNPSATTLLEDIERTEEEKREEEARLIAEGELVVGQLENEDNSEQMTEKYTELYRRERAHVLFERRKRLLTGAAWSLMRCANTGQPFYFNADTREATWECPPVWLANQQLKSARKRGYEGLPPPALQRVISMLTPYPERFNVQMVCRSWHTAAQHLSLFTKVSASDFEPGASISLTDVLAKVATGDTVLFGPGVYHVDEPVEISRSLRLLATPDCHVELQMHSSRAQLVWSARGGVLCGFHFTRSTNNIADSPEIILSSDVKEAKPMVKEKRRTLRKQNKKLTNWQHLLSVVGDGELRVEYCEFDGNGLGNACICVWGRAERKKRKRKTKNGSDTPNSTPQDAILTPSTPIIGSTASRASIPAADTLLVLQNCRIRGAGSSGVLLMRGSLVMTLNTVENNAHSGITVFGGHAIVRRNKIQRNGRFGLRLLYHAGNIIVEDNVVFGNTCGNLDVDNSGRRFVVRLNDMDKGKSIAEKLPHSHGKLRLMTYRVLEKEVPRASNSDFKPTTTSATGTSITALPMGFMRPVTFPQGVNPMHLPMALASLKATSTVPSVALSRSISTQPMTTTVSLQRTVSAPNAVSSTRPGLPPAITNGNHTTTVNTVIESQKKRRERRPKTQQMVVGGGEMILRDTCEKRVEKVVKPRRPKELQTPQGFVHQMTSPSALQLKFAPGSTAAAVAAAMNAMIANTAKMQAAVSSAAAAMKAANLANLTTKAAPIAKTPMQTGSWALAAKAAAPGAVSGVSGENSTLKFVDLTGKALATAGVKPVATFTTVEGNFIEAKPVMAPQSGEKKLKSTGLETKALENETNGHVEKEDNP